MNAILPGKVFLTRGMGRHAEKLVSFEIALRDAGISSFNLVRVSSIFPPRCRIVSREAGLKLLKPGQIVFLVMSENATDEPHRLISSSIGMAIPEDADLYGYLAEHEAFGVTEKEAGRHTEDLAAEMLATKLGMTLSPRSIPRSGRPQRRLSPSLSLRTKSISQTAKGAAGLWTTTVAAAVLIA